MRKRSLFIIKSNDQLMELIKIHALKPAASAQSVCMSIIKRGYDKAHVSVRIVVAKSLIPESYHRVAAMFAKSMEQTNPYEIVHSFINNGDMIVFAGSHKLPTTFKARVIRTLRKTKKFETNMNDIPKTYRTRPVVLTCMLRKELGCPVAFSAKKNVYTWTIA